MTLSEKIEQSIRARELFSRGQRILIAVSGGMDSMVLLHLLHQLSKRNKWNLTVAHLNHGLRGRSSNADERLVQKTAANFKLRFVSERADVKKFAKANRLSIEMAARKLRHEFLARTAKNLKIKSIALAHHADDQVELFFLRLFRGAGTEGLSGMNWIGLSPADPSLQLVRPLFDQSKEILREFAKGEKIPFHEDASNALPDFQRNRIRHELIPLLKRNYQPALEQNILRTMEIVSCESHFVLGAALDWLSSKKKPPLDQLHIAVQRVCLRMQLRSLGFSGDFDLIEGLRLQPETVVAVNPKVSVVRDSAGIVHRRINQAFSFNETEMEIHLRGPGEVEFDQRKISWSFQNKKGASFQLKPNAERFDADKVGPRIHLRHWKPGDRFQPIGRKTPVKLQNIFTNLKIPRAERHRLVVATTGQGEVFWVEGLRISERFKLDIMSKRQLKWHWQCFGKTP